ncbi:MAG: tRNA adenosine(34) deaminase TadA [Elusimicrobiota bacterium]|nr:tRNA adenosine(34) deaminase TadA [Endomicrobiia bacterium]MDW8165299.1 tRNA adenosine(34) deaminase TadA [Elusimicrobiota bacterium]
MNKTNNLSREFMLEAIKEAKKAYNKNEVPVGCVIVYNGKILSKAHNLNITLNDPTAHAEILAIKKASKKINNYRLNDCELYVTLEPCPMCAGAIVNARIKKVFYAIEDPKAGSCKSVLNIVNNNKLNHQAEIYGGICKKEAKNLLKRFFERLRNQRG